MGSRIDEKKKQKQEALLSSAFSLFTEKGIKNTSISDIVKQAKLAKGTFYLYFKDKYDIRDKLITHKASQLFARAHEELQRETVHSLEERVIFIADNVINQLAKDTSLLKFITKNLSWAIFSNIRITQMENRSSMDIFKKMIEDSERKFRKPELMIYLIVELISSTCYNVILNKSPCTLEELKQELNEIICGVIHQFEITDRETGQTGTGRSCNCSKTERGGR